MNTWIKLNLEDQEPPKDTQLYIAIFCDYEKKPKVIGPVYFSMSQYAKGVYKPTFCTGRFGGSVITSKISHWMLVPPKPVHPDLEG